MDGPSRHDEDPLAALIGDGSSMWRTYAVPQARVLFVQVNKNACTSLKWMMAGVAGEDSFRPSLMPSTGDVDDIHDRRQWQKSPRLDRMDPALRAQIHPDRGWFVFAVTRDPRARLFSAWQSKLLLDNPGYRSFQGEAWYPRHPATTESVVEDFGRFVDLLEREPGHRIRADGHFRDQVDLLHEDVVAFTEIYDIRELDRLQADLRRHLDQVGWTGELRLPRLNDTPLRSNAQPFVDGVRERVEKLYAADFERFGDRWDFADLEASGAWTAEDLERVDLQADYGRRIGYLRDRALRFKEKAAHERRRADAEKARADALELRLHEREGAVPGRGSLRQGFGRVGARLRRRIGRRG